MAINWQSGAQGGLGGAASGAAIGSAIPGIGTAIGAGAGGLLGLLSGLFSGGSSKSKNSPIPGLPGGYRALPTGQSQSQLDILNQLAPLAFSGIQQSQNIDPILEQARTQFQQKTIPSIAERFVAMGGKNALGSGAFTSQLGQAGSQLEESLAALKVQHQQALLPLLMNLLGMGLQPQYDIIQKNYTPGFGERALGGTIQGATSLLPLLALLKSGQQSSQAFSLPQNPSPGFGKIGFGQFGSNPELQAVLRSQGGFY